LTYEIILPPKWITIAKRAGDTVSNSYGLIQFNDINTRPLSGNKLILRGTGSRYHADCKCVMSNTTLAFPVTHTSISGQNSNNIEFQNIHFTKNKIKTTQGRVERVGTGNEDYLVVQLEVGFPTLAPFPAGVTDTSISHGRKIRRYRLIVDPNSPGGFNPVYIRPDPEINAKGGVVWEKAEKINDQYWKVYTLPRWHRYQFSKDQKVGIKTKHGKHAYYFEGDSEGGRPSSRISFIGVQWTQETRGIFRGVDVVSVRNSYAGPDPYLRYRLDPRRNAVAVSYLSSSAGGPQIGSADDYPLNYDWSDRDSSVKARDGGRWHSITHNNFVRLGDDAIGLFHVEDNVYIGSNRIVDGPARGVYQLNRCARFYGNVTYEDMIYINAPQKNIEQVYDYRAVPVKHSWSRTEANQRCNAWTTAVCSRDRNQCRS